MLVHASWNEYVRLRDAFDRPGLRLTYLEGTLEIMSPSPEHELWKKNIARLVELYAHVRGIDLYGYGSTTFRKEASLRGAEPDECYLIGKKLADYPEIVLEVIHTSPLVDKLDVYRGFGIAEVWVFRDGRFTIHALTTSGYDVRTSSSLVPGLDFDVLATYAVRDDTPVALREYQKQLG